MRDNLKDITDVLKIALICLLLCLAVMLFK